MLSFPKAARPVDKTWKLGRWSIRLSVRSKDGMGRFGAGWNYKIGAQWSSSSCVLISLLIAELMISRKPKTAAVPV